MRRRRSSSLALWLCLGLLASCKQGSSDPASVGSAPAGSAAGPAELNLIVAYGSEKKTWLEEEARAFEASAPRLASGKRLRIDGRALGSGEATQGILSGTLKAHVFSPASGAYVAVLNQSWLSIPGHTQALCPAGEPVVLSPIVIAMWKPMAEALGWPAKQLGWSDLLKVNADPKGWGGRGHPEWGAFKLGHTHPEFSNSGLLAVLAEAYAGAKKTRGITAADLQAKGTAAFMTKVESTIVHYGKSTGFFADKMISRGPAYLSAAVLYENLIIESNARESPSGIPIVAIYPAEGTFWSDHPYAVLDADWVGPEEREAAALFLKFLQGKAAQTRALSLGFRPADASIAIGAPIDAAHGVDPKQPQTLLEVPDGKVLSALLEAWKQNKRPTDVTLVFDKSGSMDGKPMREARAGAKAFLSALGDRDTVTLQFFDSQIYPPVGPVLLQKARQELLSRFDAVVAGGGTALYDVIAAAVAEQGARARKSPGSIHAVVVMTYGKDEDSHAFSLDSLKTRLSAEGPPADGAQAAPGEATVRVFTIAYGDAADPAILQSVAEAAKGSSLRGNSTNIIQVYQDMASFF